MLDIQGRQYAAVTVCDVTLYDIITKYPVMFFDTLQVTSVDGATEVTEIQGGKGNPILASISHSKNVDVQFDDAIMTMASLALLTGGELRQSTDSAKITMTQTELVELAAGATKLKLSRKIKAGSYVYVAQMIDGVLSTATRSDVVVATEADEILLSAFHNFEAPLENATYRVFYSYEMGFPTSGQELNELTVLSDKFAGTYRFIGDTLLFNQYSGANDIFQIEIPKLKLDGAFSFSLNAATEAVVFSFNGKALRDDLGRLIVFRSLSEGSAAVSSDELGQLDGSFAKIPAKEVTVNSETGALTDTGRTYPVPGTPSV